jgi:hypothetical protein
MVVILEKSVTFVVKIAKIYFQFPFSLSTLPRRTEH